MELKETDLIEPPRTMGLRIFEREGREWDRESFLEEEVETTLS